MTTKERPILFSGLMVRALLDGSKTQTRRVCKSAPYGNGTWNTLAQDFQCHNDYLPPSALLMDYREGGETYTTSDLEGWACCPYGQPGDRLYVRETWQKGCAHADDNTVCLAYAASQEEGRGGLLVNNIDLPAGVELWETPDQRWRPSIHMPRWASRILLEIVLVRVERLQDISDQDAIAEGIGLNACAAGVPMTTPVGESMPRALYGDLWDSINGAGNWDANPWVWCVTFRKVA